MQYDMMFEPLINEKAFAEQVDKMMADYQFTVAQLGNMNGAVTVLDHLKNHGARILTGPQIENLKTLLDNQNRELESLRSRVREFEVQQHAPPPSLDAANGTPAPVAIDCSDVAPASDAPLEGNPVPPGAE